MVVNQELQAVKEAKDLLRQRMESLADLIHLICPCIRSICDGGTNGSSEG
jgi:hypothetical protein